MSKVDKNMSTFDKILSLYVVNCHCDIILSLSCHCDKIVSKVDNFLSKSDCFFFVKGAVKDHTGKNLPLVTNKICQADKKLPLSDKNKPIHFIKAIYFCQLDRKILSRQYFLSV